MPLVAAYCVMFFLAAGGNLSVIISLYRSKRHRRSRISLMICHLAVADLIVAFFMIPLEVSADRQVILSGISSGAAVSKVRYPVKLLARKYLFLRYRHLDGKVW